MTDKANNKKSDYVSFTTQYSKAMHKRIEAARKALGLRGKAEAVRQLIDRGLKEMEL